MCNTRFWGLHRSKLDISPQKYIIWSQVFTRRRYTPLCHLKNPDFTEKNVNFWDFSCFLDKKPHFWSPGDQCWVKTNGNPLKHYFLVIDHEYCVMGCFQTQKKTDFTYFSGFSRIFGDFFGHKIPFLWTTGDQCGVKTIASPLKHYFTLIYRGYCGYPPSNPVRHTIFHQNRFL